MGDYLLWENRTLDVNYLDCTKYSHSPWLELTLVIIGSDKWYFFSQQLPEHDAEAVDIKLNSSWRVDVIPVLRWNVSDRASLWPTTCLRRRVLTPLGQPKITYLCSDKKIKVKKAKEYHTPWSVLVECSSPLLTPWDCSCINHLSLWHMASAMPDQWLPSQQ